MSEQEKKMAEIIADALPKMSEFDKGYFFRAAEEISLRAETEKKEAKENDGRGTA